LKIGVSTYSFWHFRGPKTPIEYVMDRAWELGLDGVEILHVQMESQDKSYVNMLKRHALSLGLDIYCLATHQNFVKPSREDRLKEVKHTERCLELAYRLGAPAIRINSGRWGTVESFSELMARKGSEPPLEGYTEEDAYRWVIDSINMLIPLAEEYGIVLALENHWGLTSTPEGILRIVETVNSPWLRVLMDTGNFLENPLGSLEAIAPYTCLVHVKTYYGGGEWYELEIDYEKVIDILRSVGFKGYLSIEFEGRMEPYRGVKKTVSLLRRILSKSIEPC